MRVLERPRLETLLVTLNRHGFEVGDDGSVEPSPRKRLRK